LKYYLKNEMSTEYIINGLKMLKIHNPNCFHLFYGGEPFLRSDLDRIIHYCNHEDIHYTVITNNSDQIQPLIEDVLKKVDISGLTSSVDPVIYHGVTVDDIFKKSFAGLERLSKYKDTIKDRVAEITVSKENQKYLYPLVKELSNRGINSSITFIDIAKSPYYDFSNIHDENLLVERNEELEEQFEKIFDEKLDVHMGKPLLNKILDILPSNLNCDLDKNLHNITIDADGSIRLCLRIKGVSTPKIKLDKVFNEDGDISTFLKVNIGIDKKLYCKGCNWTCVLMSKAVDEESINSSDLIHSDRRK